MAKNYSKDLARIIKQQRILNSLTLSKLGNISGISPSHLTRIERGERFPSARTLRKIAKPLGFTEDELFMLAGYLSQPLSIEDKTAVSYDQHRRLEPYVASMLAQEPIEIQRAVIGILSILKSIAKGIRQE